MSEPRDIELGEEERSRTVEMPRPRAVGSPLAMGLGSRPAILPARPEAATEQPAPAAPETERIFSSRSNDEEPVARERTDRPADLPADPIPNPVSNPASNQASDQPSSLQRAVNGVRAAWPFVQKILPLLDGQVITAVSNLLTPHHPPAAAQVNLTPLESSLTDLKTRHGELSDQLTQQNASLKKVEDRLEMVREATDRNTLEQQELMADLKSVGRKVNVIAVLALLLLAGSVAINILLFLHIKRVLP
jgi:hypothetical protein